MKKTMKKEKLHSVLALRYSYSSVDGKKPNIINSLEKKE